MFLRLALTFEVNEAASTWIFSLSSRLKTVWSVTSKVEASLARGWESVRTLSIISVRKRRLSGVQPAPNVSRAQEADGPAMAPRKATKLMPRFERSAKAARSMTS